MSHRRFALLLAVALLAVGWWIVHSTRDGAGDPEGPDRLDEAAPGLPLADADAVDPQEAASLKGRAPSDPVPELMEPVRVQVIDEDDTPVPRATLKVYARTGGGTPLLVLDVVDGEASFQLLDDTGTVSLHVCEPRSADGHLLDLAWVTERNVPPHRQWVRIVLPPARTLSGRVLYEDGKPGAGLVVLATGYESGEDGPSATTDARGRFTLHGVPQHAALVRLQDGQGWRAHWSGFIRPDEDDVQLIVTRVGDVEILVLDPQGAPLPGAGVRVVCERTNHELQGETAEDGIFVAKGCVLDAGCSIDVDPTRCKPPYPRVSVTVPAARDGRHTVRLAPAAWLRGSVLDPDGGPVAGVPVTAETLRGSGTAGITHTDEDGHFDLGPLGQGSYNVQVWLTDLEWLPPLAQRVETTGQPVELVCVRPLTLCGRIQGGDPTWTQVTWHGEEGCVEFESIDPDGTFEITRARAGRGTLRVGDADSCGLYLTDLDTSDSPFEIDCRTWKDIRGKVDDRRSDRRRPPRLWVALGAHLAPVNVGADGGFRTPRLPPGTYTLEAWNDEGSFPTVTADAGDRNVVVVLER